MAKYLKPIGLVDADLMDGGTRHPNLVLLKLAGFLRDNNVPFKLIEDTNEDISKYKLVYISRVFSFTKEPEFCKVIKGTSLEKKIRKGGTGYYATEKSISKFVELRRKDMCQLESDSYLNTLTNFRGGPKQNGIDMQRQMPYYDLYRDFVKKKLAEGGKRDHWKDYLDYSIGFLTRGCFRHCPFCINKLERDILPYSELEWFWDRNRPYIYLWDDNFLASRPEVWRPLLQELIDTGRPFQFRQGLDERMLAQSEYGEEMAEMLSHAKYHGDYIFAFDNWKDRELITRALRIWKHYNPKKGTKFYLFCGFMLTEHSDDKFYKDIWELFHRIHILMQYGCVGYVMRHEDYKKYELGNFYVQVARWCNQQAFYKKMSFWEFAYRNQSFWEETTLKRTDRPRYKTYEETMEDVRNGYYETTKMCKTLKTVIDVLDRFSNPEQRAELLEMFNYKMQDLINPRLWE